MISNKKLLITGGSDFIGSAVIRHIINNTNHSVVNVDKFTYTGNLESLTSIDKNLRTYNAYTDLLNLEKHPNSPIFLNNDQILEVKFSEPLPPFLNNVLSSFSLIRCSISKYVLSQRYTDYSAVGII
ncbi:NAD-dependent epimerase/dehydratase family protein [Beggiatoa alba]|nr:NAD-dependent epimerase/dehydratase family protein [Beggiatoa alba]